MARGVVDAPGIPEHFGEGLLGSQSIRRLQGPLHDLSAPGVNRVEDPGRVVAVKIFDPGDFHQFSPPGFGGGPVLYLAKRASLRKTHIDTFLKLLTVSGIRAPEMSGLIPSDQK